MKLFLFKSLLLFLILAQLNIAKGQFNNPASAGAYGIGLGDIRSTLINPQAVFSNPGALAFVESSTIATFIDSRYFINNLYGVYVGGYLHSGIGGFGVDLYQYGWNDYTESSIALQYGRKFSENLGAGIKFKYHQFQINEYGEASAIGIDLGAVQKITKNFRVGLIISNPFSGKINENEDLQSSLLVGFAYSFSGKLAAMVEFHKEERDQLIGRLGIQYLPLEKLRLTIGYQSIENQISFGFGFKPIQSLAFNIAATLHPILGTSSALGVEFTFI